MDITCPHCHRILEGDDSLAGMTVECPACNGTIVVPVDSETQSSSEPKKSIEQTGCYHDNTRKEQAAISVGEKPFSARSIDSAAEAEQRKNRKGLVLSVLMVALLSGLPLIALCSCLEEYRSWGNMDDSGELFAICLPLILLPIVGLVSAIRLKQIASFPKRMGVALLLIAIGNGLVGLLCANARESTIITAFCVAEPVLCVILFVLLFSPRRINWLTFRSTIRAVWNDILATIRDERLPRMDARKESDGICPTSSEMETPNMTTGNPFPSASENESEKPTLEQWLRGSGLHSLSSIRFFFRFEKPITTDISGFNGPASTFEFRRLFPLAICCLVFGWIVGPACHELEVDWHFMNRWVVLPVAISACWIAIRGMLHFVRPNNRPWVQWLFVFLFTAIIGIILLLLVQYCVSSAQVLRSVQRTRVRGGALFKVIFLFIGWCYEKVYDPEATILSKFVGYIGGVGFCEESVKLLPVFLLIAWRRKLPFKVDLSFRSVLMLGFFSGLGFGVSETLTAPYCIPYYISIGGQFLRWFSCVPSHAIYATIDSAFLWMFSRHLMSSEDGKIKFAWFAACVAAVSILHGVYDTLCSVPFFGLFLDAASLVLLWFVVRRAVFIKDPESKLNETSFLDFELRTNRTFGKSFAKTYLCIGLCILVWSIFVIDR